MSDNIFRNAKWIYDPTHNGQPMQPVSAFVRDFAVNKTTTATLRLSACGIVRPLLDGQPITDELFLPGWTDFKLFREYREFEIPLECGRHTLTLELADGWFAGHISWGNNENKPPCVIAELVFDNNIVCTNDSWQCSNKGKFLYSDIYMGEYCDPSIPYQDFHIAAITNDMKPEKYSGVPVRKIRKYPEISRHGNIVDFGFNITGYAVFKITAPKGRKIVIHYAEVLDSNGNLYRQNLRSATAEDIYISPGGTTIYEPSFTFHGFRYIEVSGADDFTAEAWLLHSDFAFHNHFESSSPLLNQLVKNIELCWRDNALELPTDCPQRDERRGWLGDAQIFCQSALYLADVKEFFRHFLKLIRAAQRQDGAFPTLVPLPYWGYGQAGWSDAGVIIPYEIYRFTQDISILEENYSAIKKYIAYNRNRYEKGQLLEAGHGDWLNLDAPTDKELLGDAFFAHSTVLAGKIAEILHDTATANDLNELFAELKTQFMQKHSDKLTSQSACAIALHFDLLEGNLKQKAIDFLVHDITINRNLHLSSGFLGTPYLLHALSDNGHNELAWALLEQTTYPSWLYQVKMGATTMWERWDSLTEKGFAKSTMNSFNHYAYGSVYDWLIGKAVGIQPDFSIDPHPGGSLKYIEAAYRNLTVRWEKLDDNNIRYTVNVPENTIANFRGKKLASGVHTFICRQ